jgi:hypothetical protein
MDELPDVVRRLIDFANDGDLDAFLGEFTPDGVVDDWGRTFEGADQITRWSDAEFIGKEVTLDVTDVRARGNEWTITAEVGGEGFNGPSHFTFRVADDAIARMTIRE